MNRDKPSFSARDSTPAELLDVVRAARALLDKIENITTEEFRFGAEKEEREALKDALEKLDAL